MIPNFRPNSNNAMSRITNTGEFLVDLADAGDQMATLADKVGLSETGLRTAATYSREAGNTLQNLGSVKVGMRPPGAKAVKRTSIETTPQTVASGVGTKTKTKVKEQDMNKKGSGTNAGGRKSGSIDFVPDNMTGYSIYNGTTTPSNFVSPIDDSLYLNPYLGNKEPFANQANNIRTRFNCIQGRFDAIDDLGIWSDIYNDIKININIGTKGGTQASNNYATKDKLLWYFKSIWILYLEYICLLSIQSWNAPTAYSNLVLRNLANQASTTNLLSLRNEMAEILGRVVLPRKMVEYAYFIMQVTKTNPKSTSIDQKFITNIYGAQLLLEKNESTYISGINALMNEFKITDVSGQPEKLTTDQMSQVTGLLLANSGLDLVPLRNLPAPLNTSCYNRYFNDIFHNQPQINLVSNTPNYYPSQVSNIDSYPAAFCSELNDIPIHVMDSLAAGFANRKSLLMTPRAITDSSAEGRDSNKVIAYLNSAMTEVFCAERDTLERNVGDDATSIETAGTTTKWTTHPRGESQYLYEVGFNNVDTCQRDFAYYLFS